MSQRTPVTSVPSFRKRSVSVSANRVRNDGTPATAGRRARLYCLSTISLWRKSSPNRVSSRPPQRRGVPVLTICSGSRLSAASRHGRGWSSTRARPVTTPSAGRSSAGAWLLANRASSTNEPSSMRRSMRSRTNTCSVKFVAVTWRFVASDSNATQFPSCEIAGEWLLLLPWTPAVLTLTRSSAPGG